MSSAADLIKALINGIPTDRCRPMRPPKFWSHVPSWWKRWEIITSRAGGGAWCSLPRPALFARPPKSWKSCRHRPHDAGPLGAPRQRGDPHLRDCRLLGAPHSAR